MITGAGNVVNDYYDREIDAVNRPKRPIPSGRISPKSALNYSLILFAAGCLLAALVNQLCLLVAAFNSAILFFYARNLKTTPLAGNLCVAYLTGSTFLFGGATAGQVGLLANEVPFLALLFSHHEPGDRERHRGRGRRPPWRCQDIANPCRRKIVGCIWLRPLAWLQWA